MNDAVDFWNEQLAEMGSGFRLGPVRFISEILPTSELATLSQATLDGQRALVGPPSGFMQIEGDLVIALSDGAFVSFATSFQKTDKRLIAIRNFQGAIAVTSIGRNIMAHELGHAIDLGKTMTLVSSCAVDPRLVGQRLSFRRGAIFSSDGRRKTHSAKALPADVEGCAEGDRIDVRSAPQGQDRRRTP